MAFQSNLWERDCTDNTIALSHPPRKGLIQKHLSFINFSQGQVLRILFLLNST